VTPSAQTDGAPGSTSAVEARFPVVIAMCLLLSALANYLERRTRRSKKRIDLDPAGKAKAEGEVLAHSPRAEAAPDLAE